jgi:hypothetical protein
MSDTHRIEIEVGDHTHAALQGEADRLGLPLADVIARATAAWLNDMGEAAADTPGALQVAQ